MIDLLRRHAETRGDRIAYEDDRRAVTFAELFRRSGRLAGHLADAGVERGDRVAMVMSNRVEMVESYLAVLRAGAVGVPLNPSMTRPELAALLAGSDPRVVIADEHQATRLSPVRAQLVTVEDLLDREPVAGPRDDAPGEEPAWTLFTSGTTGRQKGVLLTPDACLRAARASVEVLGLGPDDRVLWPLGLFHSFSHSFALHSALIAGARVRLVNGFAPEMLLAQLSAEPYTVLAGVPAMYHRLLRVTTGHPAPSLRVCLTAGAPAAASLRRTVAEVFGAPLCDVYGCTETSGPIAISTPSAPPELESCGAPVPGVQVRLVDPETALPLPPGSQGEGEVHVGGATVMAGYRNDPDATALALPDGWYRTGDVARQDADGRLTVTGRVRELINRGGEKIHPAEVEQALISVPGVADAAVRGAPDPVLGQVPEAYLVAGEDEIDPGAVLAAVRERLAPFKVPVRLYQVGTIPRTASGKITRHLLPEAVVRELPLPSPPPVKEPAPSTLAAVRTATAALIGVPGPADVDPERGFTEQGIDSSGAVELAGRLAAITGAVLPATVVFDHPTPAALARYIDAGTRSGPAPGEAVPRSPDDDDAIAVIGMACRYPGGIRSPEDLWRLLAEGGDAITPFPADRGWDLDALYHP
ncbi:MAG: AMP-binding protein, partial [Actinomycetota bacterium]|nr:AMP-binding protein [Actinomycetota bacterium]